jgi:hypothetical protein
MLPRAPRLARRPAATYMLSVAVALLAAGLIAAAAAQDAAYEDRTQFAAVDTPALPPAIGTVMARDAVPHRHRLHCSDIVSERVFIFFRLNHADSLVSLNPSLTDSTPIQMFDSSQSKCGALATCSSREEFTFTCSCSFCAFPIYCTRGADYAFRLQSADAAFTNNPAFGVYVSTAAAASFVDRTPTSYVCKTCASPHYLVNTTDGKWVLSTSVSGAAPLASVASATVTHPPPFGWGMCTRVALFSVFPRHRVFSRQNDMAYHREFQCMYMSHFA